MFQLLLHVVLYEAQVSCTLSVLEELHIAAMSQSFLMFLAQPCLTALVCPSILYLTDMTEACYLNDVS